MIQLSRAIQVFYFLTTVFVNLHTAISKPSRAYPEGCANQQQCYYDYDNYPLKLHPDQGRARSDFRLVRRLGAGKFSDVFEAVDARRSNQNKIADIEGAEYIDVNSLVVIKVIEDSGYTFAEPLL